VVSHYNIRRVVDIYGAVQDRDLGAVGRDIARIVDANQKLLPRGSVARVRGQLETMRTSYVGLLEGLAFAIVLVYLLIVVNFQSWLDPFIIITALPAALAGIVVFLFLTGTTLSVPALMGAIMSIGVATANSILVVAFAKGRLGEHGDASTAAVEAGFTRFRPVLMTCAGDDHRHDADGAGARRGWRAKRPAGAGGDRRSPVRHHGHPRLRSRRVRAAPRPADAWGRAHDDGTGSGARDGLAADPPRCRRARRVGGRCRGPRLRHLLGGPCPERGRRHPETGHRRGCHSPP
jgi:hypothetical protein